MPVSLTAKCAMLKGRDFCGKPAPNLRQRRGSIGQVAEVWSKIRISMEGASKGRFFGEECQGDKQQSGSGQGNGSSVNISEVINNGWLSR